MRRLILTIKFGLISLICGITGIVLVGGAILTLQESPGVASLSLLGGLGVFVVGFKSIKTEKNHWKNQELEAAQKQSERKENTGEIKDLKRPKTPVEFRDYTALKIMLLLVVMFLLLSGWVALLLTPPFGTAFAILLFFVVAARSGLR